MAKKTIKEVKGVAKEVKAKGTRTLVKSQNDVAKPTIVTVSFRREIEIANVKGKQAELKKSLNEAFNRYLDLKLAI